MTVTISLRSFLLLFLHECRTGIPGPADLFTGQIIIVLELIEQDGVQLFRSDLAILAEYSFLGFHVDDPADNPVHIIGVEKLQKFAFHYDGEFFNDRRIDLVALNGMIAGSFKFVVDLVAGGDAEEIGHIHMIFISKRNGKSPAGFDVEP